MVSTRKKRQSNRRLLSHLDDFDQDVIIGNAMIHKQENTTVNEGTANQEFTVGNSDGGQALSENVVKVKTLERCFNEKIDREIGNIVETVEDRIHNAILTAIDNFSSLKTELAIRSINVSSGRDATSVMATSERVKRIGFTAPLEKLS